MTNDSGALCVLTHSGKGRLQSRRKAQKGDVDVAQTVRYNKVPVDLYGWRNKVEEKEMAEKKNILTYEGLKALEDELQDLKVNRRQQVAIKIKEAREQGDLSENAEYDAAKDEQREIELRIEEIDKILKNAEVVVEEDVDVNTINVGCMVKLRDVEFDEVIEYKIVGSTEADCLNGKISNESPVGMALIGARVGETIEVETPTGEMVQYEILEIQKSGN